MSDKKNNSKSKAKSIVALAQKHLRKYYKEKIPPQYKFHQYSYFKSLVKLALKMAKAMNLPEQDEEVLQLAMWFRYSGIVESYENYENISVGLADAFLKSNSYDPAKTEQVKQLILSTRKEQDPQNAMEEIMRDAAVAYAGRKRFFTMSSLLRVELEEVQKKIIKNKAWAEQQYDFLTHTTFATSYANQQYQNRLAKNIQKQRKLIQKAKTAAIRKKTGKEFGRGIDTLYRTSYRNHINLSSIADGKANMMISINTIILSAVITLLGTSMSFSGQFSFEHFRYFVPIIILLIFVSISAVFAVMSARPKVTKNEVSTADIMQRTKSILFFGNFISMKKDEFVENMDLLKRNQSLLYDNMSVDMYFLGHVLDRKYRLIKYSYNVFIVGLLLCVAAFLFILIYTQIRGI